MLIYFHIFVYLQTVGGGYRYARIRPDIPEFAPLRRLIAHTAHTKMATITKLPSGARHKSRSDEGVAHASETFLRRDDAHRLARQAETRVDQGLAPNKSSISRLQTFGDLIDLHIADMCEVGKPPRREPRRPR